VPGSATLNNSLRDQMIGVVDDIRSSVEDLGSKQYRVFVVKRVSASSFAGQGPSTETETEIEPRPIVMPWNDREHKAEGCGLLDSGKIKIINVSLSYEYSELYGEGSNNTEFFIRVKEGQSQGQPPADFVFAQEPYASRVKGDGTGWVLKLKRAGA